MIFPFIDTTRKKESTRELPIFKEVEWDFENNVPVIVDGQPKFAEKNNAIRVWIHKALNTERFKYLAYSENFGNELESLIGISLSQKATESEAKRFITECLMANPYIKRVDNIEIIVGSDNLYAKFIVYTIYDDEAIQITTEALKVEKDTEPPIPENDGLISTNNIKASEITISWDYATDNITPKNELQYYIYVSNTNNINTLQECKQNGTLLFKEYAVNFKRIKDLEADTNYYFNIIVKDKAGNEAIYNSATGKTLGTGRITGAVLNSLGEPLGMVNVYLKNTLGLTIKKVITTGSGIFDFDVEFGDYNIEFEKEGYISNNYLVTIDENNALEIINVNLLRLEIHGTVTNAETGLSLEGVQIKLFNNLNQIITETISDSQGLFYFVGLEYKEYKITFEKEGFINAERLIEFLPSDTIINTSISLTEQLPPNRVRIVLNWGSEPLDLDAHLITSSGLHIYYSNKNQGGITLDVDDTNGYGPETVTLDLTVNETYLFYVYNYTGGNFVNDAEVSVYGGESLLKKFNISNAGDLSNRYWKVFSVNSNDLIAETSDITEYNFTMNTIPTI